MPSTPDPRLLALIDAHAAGRGRIQDRVFAALYATWVRFDGWYRDSLVSEAAAAAFDVVAAGQSGQAALTDAYLARATTLTRGAPVAPIGVAPAMRESLRVGVTGPQIQERVASEFRWQIFRGLDPDTARDVALNRARESATQDLNLAFQRQVANFTQKRRVTQWRRVTRGEGVCGLCMAASHRVYGSGDLLPMHARCRCSVIEVGAVLGGGKVTSDAEYQALAGESRSLSARDLKDVRWTVEDNSELGPVLRNANQRISGVDRSGRVQGKGPSSPEAKVLDPANRVSTMTVDDVARAEQIARKSLEFARTNDLPKQVDWHTARLAALDARRAQLTA